MKPSNNPDSRKLDRTPRGLRNCNPLNIRKSAAIWQGLHPEQNDPDFFRFNSMAWGYRAAFIVLRTYHRKYGLNTVEKIIARWAPPENGNDTDFYIRKVCALTGFEAQQPLNPCNPHHMPALVAAMSRVENGCRADLTEIRKGWELYLG